MPQWLGSRTRKIFYEESVFETDPGTPVGYVLPESARSDFGTQQDPIDAEIFKGDREPFGNVPGLIQNDGDTPLGFEYRTLGRIEKVFLGATPAAPVATGGGQLHYFVTPTNGQPGSCQIQTEYLQGPSFVRRKGVRLGTMRSVFQPAGVCQYTLGKMGVGREVQTDLAGTKTDDGYVGQTYFNGFLEKAGVSQGGVAGFEFTKDNKLSRQDVAFRGGLAGGINPGVPMYGGTLTALLENLDFYNEAIGGAFFGLEFMWANAPIATCTQFYFISLPQVQFFRGRTPSGGQEGLVLAQPFRAQRPDTLATGLNALAAFAFSNKETYNIGASSFNLGIKIDGGGTITKVLTQGAARTAAQVVTDIGTITGGSADVWPKDALGVGGRVRIRTNAKGVAGSVQIDTAVATSAHTALGFDGTVRTGKAPSAYHSFLLNDLTATY